VSQPSEALAPTALASAPRQELLAPTAAQRWTRDTVQSAISRLWKQTVDALSKVLRNVEHVELLG
ncbi:MAG: hypothetical protein ACXVI5_05990, partial [Halobacteriota archaeon]